jgi:twitching motility protein PilT
LRDQFASTLEAVISQQLLPRADGQGLIMTCEVLIATPATRQLIRENRTEALNDAIMAGGQFGMISKDASIKALYQKKLITKEVAQDNLRNPEHLLT